MPRDHNKLDKHQAFFALARLRRVKKPSHQRKISKKRDPLAK